MAVRTSVTGVSAPRLGDAILETLPDDRRGAIIKRADVARRQGNTAEARRLAGVLKTLTPLPVDRTSAASSEDAANQYFFYYADRAAMAAALGDRDQAVELISHAMRFNIRTTRDFHRVVYYRSLHDYPPFQELLRPEG